MAVTFGCRFSWGSIPHRRLLATGLGPAVEYSHLVANLRSVNDALDQVDRVGKEALRRDDQAATLTATRLYALLLAAVAECALLKILREQSLTSGARKHVLEAGSQAEMWLAAIDTGFRRHYAIPPPRDLAEELDVTPRARRDILRAAVTADLSPTISLRNSIAHGQWEHVLTNTQERVNFELTRRLKSDDLAGLHHKRRILAALAHCVHDLVVSAATFDRDFDSHFREVERHRRALQSSDFPGYVDYLRRRHEKRKNYLAADSKAAAQRGTDKT